MKQSSRPDGKNKGRIHRRQLTLNAVRSVSLTAVLVLAVGLLSTPIANAERYVNGILIHGEIEKEYQAMINIGRALGDPTTEELQATGGRWQEFGSNSIYWKHDVGAHQIGGSIRTKWGTTGWENGILGYPTTRENILPTGRFNHFQGGSIYWTQATGANMVRGWMRDRWAEQGWETGPLNYPVGDEYDYNGGVRQDFQGGSLELNVKPELDLDPNDTSPTIGVDDPSNLYPGEIVGRIADIARTCGQWQGDYRICTTRGTGVEPGPTTPDPTVLRAPQAPQESEQLPQDPTEVIPGTPETPAPSTTSPIEPTTPASPSTESCVTPSAAPTTTTLTPPDNSSTPTPTTCLPPPAPQAGGSSSSPPPLPSTISTPASADSQSPGYTPMSVTKPLRQQQIPNAAARPWCDDTQEDVRSERHYACAQSNTQFDMEFNGDLNFDGELDVIGTAFAKVELGMRTKAKDASATGVGSLRIQYQHATGPFADRAFEFKIVDSPAQPATFDAEYYNGSSRTSSYSPGTWIPLEPEQEHYFVIDQKFQDIAVNGAPVSSALVIDLQGQFDLPLIPFTTHLTTTEKFVYPQVRCDGGGGATGLTGIGCVLQAGRAILEMNAGAVSKPQLLDHVLWAQNSGLPGRPNSGYGLHRIYQSNPQRGANNRTACPQVASDPSLPRPSGYECDEYPFATSREGAAGGFNALARRTHYWCQISSRPIDVYNPIGYSICMVPAKQNSSGGGLMPSFHRKNRLLEGTDTYYVNAYHP